MKKALCAILAIDFIALSLMYFLIFQEQPATIFDFSAPALVLCAVILFYASRLLDKSFPAEFKTLTLEQSRIQCKAKFDELYAWTGTHPIEPSNAGLYSYLVADLEYALSVHLARYQDEEREWPEFRFYKRYMDQSRELEIGVA